MSDEDIHTILEAIRLAPASYGLQAYRVLVIENPTLRKEIQAVSWNQEKVTDASHLLVLVTRRDLHTVSDEYFTLMS